MIAKIDMIYPRYLSFKGQWKGQRGKRKAEN